MSETWKADKTELRTVIEAIQSHLGWTALLLKYLHGTSDEIKSQTEKGASKFDQWLYGDGTKNVIEATEFEELVEKSEFTFECDYQQYQSIKKIFEGYSISEITEDFGESIKITGKIYTSEFEDFKSTVFDKTNGKTKASFGNGFVILY